MIEIANHDQKNKHRYYEANSALLVYFTLAVAHRHLLEGLQAVKPDPKEATHDNPAVGFVRRSNDVIKLDAFTHCISPKDGWLLGSLNE